MYHRISTEPDYLGLCVSPSNFDRQLVLLKHSARVLPLAEFAQRVSSPDPLSEDIAAITFDDGYRDNLDVALPILERHRLTATVFVTTDFVDGSRRPVGERLQDAFVRLWQRELAPTSWGGVGPPAVDQLVRHTLERPGSLAALADLAFSLSDIRWERAEGLVDALEDLAGSHVPASPRMLDWDGVRQLARRGIEIGSHTVSHQILSGVSRARAEHEIVESKRRIEAEIEHEVRGFAFPNGRIRDFTNADVHCLRNAGYAYACTTERGVSGKGVDPYGILRLGAGDYAGAMFDLRLALGR
jgi:peptidoglycan/xylan/chitin deacetylase (PgdA/CDA1 family)